MSREYNLTSMKNVCIGMFLLAATSIFSILNLGTLLSAIFVAANSLAAFFIAIGLSPIKKYNTMFNTACILFMADGIIALCIVALTSLNNIDEVTVLSFLDFGLTIISKVIEAVGITVILRGMAALNRTSGNEEEYTLFNKLYIGYGAAIIICYVLMTIIMVFFAGSRSVALFGGIAVAVLVAGIDIVAAIFVERSVEGFGNCKESKGTL